MSISIGDPAPDFTLKDTNGDDVALSSFRGRSVTLVFIPFAFTGNCESELCSLRDNLSVFDRADNQVLAITCNTRHSLGVWKEQQGFGFPLLSDFWPHGSVATAYGCFNEDLGCAMRRTVVVAADGTVADIFESGGLGEVREMGSYEAALGKL